MRVGIRQVSFRYTVKSMVQVAIWGSCVSRDMCELWDDAEVVTYVARQSVVSSTHEKPDIALNLLPLKSRFQMRSLSGDIWGNAFVRLKRAKPDLVLFDIVDERRGVWEFSDGGYMTNSIEAYNLGIDTEGPKQGAKLIEFGTERHFALWREAVEKAVWELRESLPGVPIIALDVAWAENSDTIESSNTLDEGEGRRVGVKKALWKFREALKNGQSLNEAAHSLLESSEKRAHSRVEYERFMNERSRRYVEYLEPLVDATAVLPAGLAMSSAQHKWGDAPYHYIDDNYRHLIEQVVEQYQSTRQSSTGHD